MGASLAVTNPNEAGSISVGANLVSGVSTSLLNETGRVGPHDMFHDISCCVIVYSRDAEMGTGTRYRAKMKQ